MEASEKQASRERYWEECGSEQKIERLRDELKRLYRAVEEMSETITFLRSHHHLNGQLVVPMRDPNVNYIDAPRYRLQPHSLKTQTERSR